MTGRRLFEWPESLVESESESSPKTALVAGVPRLRVACRDQVVMRMLALDQMLPPEDEARTVVAFVEQADLSELYDSIRAVEGGPGRAAIDPKILLSLWLYATIKGVGSARALERQCQFHLAFQWICGDVSVNYHTLSDFRVDHAEVLDRLLTRQIAQLMSAGAVTLERVAQDGVRVPARGPHRSGGSRRWSSVWRTLKRRSRCCGTRCGTIPARRLVGNTRLVSARLANANSGCATLWPPAPRFRRRRRSVAAIR